jgi:hypothetical protein
VASLPSSTATATITNRTYVLTAVDDPSLGGRLRVQEPIEWTRPASVGVFQGLGAKYATVVRDGAPKARRFTVHVFTDSDAAQAILTGLAESASMLVYRDPFGEVIYCEIAGDWMDSLMMGAELRHLHYVDLPLVEVEPPQEA